MSKKSRDFDFSKRAASYDEGFAGRFSQRFYKLLQNEAKPVEGMRILDVGCGTGALLKRLCDKRNIIACGIDADENMIAAAVRQCPDYDIRQAKSEQIPFDDGYFDVLTACMAYHHFSDKPGFSREAARVLKPGGILCIADPKFPYLIRKSINGAARLFRVTGEFLTAREIADRFAEYGFLCSGTAYEGYAQVVKLTRAEG